MMYMHCDSMAQTYKENAEEGSSSLTFPSCSPALVLLTITGMTREGYRDRISVSERQVTLSAVTGADEGSYTVRDAKGEIQRKVCLNVRGESSSEGR